MNEPAERSSPSVVFQADASAKPWLSNRDAKRAQQVDHPLISPDGRWISFRHSLARDVRLVLIDTKTGERRELPHSEDEAWSPDSRHLATISRERGAFVISILDVEKGDRWIVLSCDDHLSYLAWSPNAEFMSFVRTERDASARPSLPDGVAEGRRGPTVFAAEYAHIRSAQRSPVDPDRLPLVGSIYVVSTQEGEARRLTGSDLGVGTFESPGNYSDHGGGPVWSPDGKSIMFTAFPTIDRDRRVYEANLMSVDLEDGRVAALLASDAERTVYAATPVVSPDGRRIAFAGFLWRAPAVVFQKELWLIDADGGEPRQIAADLDMEVTTIRWTSPSELIVGGEKSGLDRLFQVDVEGRSRELSPSDCSVILGDVSTHGVAVAKLSTVDKPFAVTTFSLSPSSTTTDWTPEVSAQYDDRQLGTMHEVHWTGGGGLPLHGFVYLPPAYDPSKRYPVILRFHGGPQTMIRAALGTAAGAVTTRLFMDRGYVTFWPEYRGGIGIGRESANQPLDGRFAEMLVDDSMAGLDEVMRLFSIDADRQYIEGGSNGGYLTALVIGRVHRFAAAVSSRGIYDWVTHFSGMAEQAWRVSRFAQPFWIDSKAWIDTSPIYDAGRVTTPTLVVVGALDRQTPAYDGEGYFKALTLAGTTHTRLAWISDIGHPELMRDHIDLYYDLATQWFDLHPTR